MSTTEIVFVNLSVLSQLRIGSRLRCRHGRFFQLYSESQRFAIPFLRWWESSSRHSDFQAIVDVYNLAADMLAQLRQVDTNTARANERALVGRVRIDRVDRPALLAPAPSSWAVEVDRSVDQVLRTTVGLDEASPKGSRACFTITVDGAEQASACRNAGQGWERLKVELPAAPGETSTVGFSILQTEAGAGGVATNRRPSRYPRWPRRAPPSSAMPRRRSASCWCGRRSRSCETGSASRSTASSPGSRASACSYS